MAEALIAKDHFYVNGSYYNDTNEDQDALISVKDNADILERSEGWLVHVTRFTCDSMRSLAYIVADETATWKILAKNQNNTVTHAWEFVLDRDYATPHDLIGEMNMKSRYMNAALSGVFRNQHWEAYRFEIDAGGRFRLKMATPPAMRNGWHISYAGSPSMNKLLGFEEITPFIRFAPPPAAQFCRALEFMERECNVQNTVVNGENGSFWKAVNDALIELLNGMEIKNMLTNTSTSEEPTSVTQLNMDSATWHTTLNTAVFKTVYKGETPSAAAHASEARLPRSGANVICEFLTRPIGQDTRDAGTKTSVTTMNWQTPYVGTGGQYISGYMEFRDIYLDSVRSPAHYPVAQPGTYQWTNSRYVYPLDSIPGYRFSGLLAHGSTQSVCVDHYWAGDDAYRSLQLENALPLYVKVGHDMWTQDQTQSSHFANIIANRFGIEYISADRKEVRVDWPFGPETRADPTYAHQDLLFTDRRVPYQSRSQSFVGVTQWYEETFNGQAVTTIVTVGDTNASVGDSLYIMAIDSPDADLAVAYPIIAADSVTKQIKITGTLGTELSAIAPPNTVSNLLGTRLLYVDKSKIDKIRWAQDTIRMKRAATTFSYQGIAPVELRSQRGYYVNGINYGPTHVQAYNTAQLVLQVKKFGDIIQRTPLFQDGGSAFAANSVTERMADDMIVKVPHSSTEIDHTTAGGVDFKARLVNAADNQSRNMIRPRHYGIRPQELVVRFPSVEWTVRMYQPSVSATGNEERARINAFVKENSSDRPIMRFVNITPSQSEYLSFTGGAGSSITTTVSPIITGVASQIDTASHTAPEVDTFIVWIPRVIGGTQPISHTAAASESTSAWNAYFSIVYDRLTRAYNLCKKEHTALALTADRESRIYGEDGDYISSSLMSQIDAIFPYRQIVLTSTDLLQVAERSQDVSVTQPILSTYTLPTIIPTSVDKEGEASGGTSQPFGTIYFSEGGTRRFHHLVKVNGGMRKFSVRAMLSYKDSSIEPTTIRLQPGGQFTCQLLFMRKNDE